MVTRIRQLLEHKQLTPTQFADLIGVGRPVMSHIFSERNKPSLDVAQRIGSAFPDVSLAWLMFGTGEMLVGAPASGPAIPPATVVAAPAAPPVAIEASPAALPTLPESAVEEPAAPASIAPQLEKPAASPAVQSAPETQPLPVEAAPPANSPVRTPVPPAVPAAVPAPALSAPRPFRAPTRREEAARVATPAATEPAAPAAQPASPEPTPPPPALPAVPGAANVAPTPPAPAPTEAALLPFLAEPGKAIRRIVIFYRDGSFADYQPEQ